jgi:RNA polymerase sigma factor (sigma-70 family)
MFKNIIDHDLESVQRAKAGSDNDLHLLWEKYQSGLNHFIRNTLPAQFGEIDIEDIMGKVLIKLITNLPKFKGECTFKTFIYCIAKNEKISFLRKHLGPTSNKVKKERRNENNHGDTIFEDPKFLVENPSPVPLEVLRKYEKVRCLLGLLKQSDKNVLVLYYYDGLTDGEIAKIIGKSKAAAKKMRQRAENALGDLYLKEESKGRLDFVLEHIKNK